MKKAFQFTNGQKLDVGTVYCIGRNYSLHAKEMGSVVPENPVVFIKPPAAYITSGDTIVLPPISNLVHYEVELVVVIRDECKNIQQDEAINHIAGYAVGIDVTLRDIQANAKKEGNPWAIAKGFFTSAPISEVVPASQFNGKIPEFQLLLKVNDELKQRCSTSLMERSIEQLIEYLSRIFTLQAGDCIFTGTPEGVGKIVKGDNIYAELTGFVSLNVTAG